MTAGLAVGTTLSVAAAGVAGAWFYSARHSQSLLEQARDTARTEGELIRSALEHQMIEDDRTLIEQMIKSFGQQARIERVVLLDREGVVQISSAPVDSDRDYAPESPTCQACHQYPVAQRMNSRVIETSGGSVLRTVIPLRNQEKCQECHDPEHKINGVLMLDLSMDAIRAGMDRDLRLMVIGTGALTLLLIAGIAVVMRVFVLRRLQQFESTARSIASGDLAQRVPERGSDTISWLAREFNTMADSMTGLLDQVHGQQQRLETVINSIDDGIVVLDPKQGVLAANEAFLQRTGLVRDRVVGDRCRDIGSQVCSGVGDCPTLSCLSSGRRQVRIFERRTAAGAVRWEEVHASPIVSATGKIVQVVEVWRDISDRRAAEARLAESHRLASLGLLASGFSHELNTPLATVLICVEGILRDAQLTEHPEWTRVAESASMAREQLLRCRGITQHFLRMSRGQSSALDIVDVRSAMAAVARLIAPTAQAHSVRVVVVPTLVPAHVRANEAELQHVLMNLLLNAIQASRPGSHVTLEVESDDPVRIRVVDHGCGIAPEQQAHIFEPFYSLRQTGTGLGLFLSLNFARHWGGDIRVTSEPGVGSTFEVTAPAAASGAVRQTA
jgi:PAS domain S-box-containing protein